MPTVQTNGIETYYEEYGDGTPIVFLHGAVSDHQLWAEQAQPLTDEYTVIVYDLRGHGRTGGSDHGSYTIDLYAEDLASLIEELELDRPVICGLSMGGWIGYEFATTYPDQLSALITLGAATPQTFSYSERIQKQVLLRAVRPLVGRERVMEGLEWIFDRIHGEDSTVDRTEVERIRDEHHCEVPELSEKERGKIWDAMLDYRSGSLQYHAITAPLLVMYGEKEPFVNEHADFLQTQVDTSRVEEIPDATHNSHVDNPEYILDTLRDFLLTTDTASAASNKEN